MARWPLAAVTVAGLLSGCVHGNESRLDTGDQAVAAGTFGSYPYAANRSLIVGGFGVCAERGAVTIDAITAGNTVGPIRIDRIGVMQVPVSAGNRNPPLAAPGTLPASYRPPIGFAVRPCGAWQPAQMVLQVRRTGRGDAGVKTIRIAYRSSTGKRHATTLYTNFVICDLTSSTRAPGFAGSCSR